MFVMDKNSFDFIDLFFETKNQIRVHIRFAFTCNIFRVGGVILRMPYLPSPNFAHPTWYEKVKSDEKSFVYVSYHFWLRGEGEGEGEGEGVASRRAQSSIHLEQRIHTGACNPRK